MSNERIYAAINTKIRVLRSKSLGRKDYISLMEKESVEEQIIYLRDNTMYGEEIRKIGSIEDVQQVEVELERHLVNEYHNLLNYFTDDYKKFFKGLLLRYEIEDLKLYLRALARNEDVDKIRQENLLLKEYKSFDIKKIRASQSIGEFIENLQGTIYYDVLKNYRFEEEAKLVFYMEMNLDRFYFKNLNSISQRLRKEDRLIFYEILGRNEDLLNIEWIYRGHKYYDLLPEELINFTLPYGYLFDYKDLKEMCYLDVDEFKEKILDTEYSFLFDTEKDVDLYMERRVQRYIYYRFLKAFKDNKLNLILPMAYFHLLEYEIRDIITILEAKKYGLAFEETKDYLVRKIEGSDE